MPPGQVNENVFERRGMRPELGKRDPLSSKFVKKFGYRLVQFRDLQQHTAIFGTDIANTRHPTDTG